MTTLRVVPTFDEVFDHIPEILHAFEQWLSTPSDADDAIAEGESRRIAAEHGVARWQQGYRRAERIQDWATSAHGHIPTSGFSEEPLGTSHRKSPTNSSAWPSAHSCGSALRGCGPLPRPLGMAIETP